MIIQSSNVSMSSNRSYKRDIKGQTTTTRWRADNHAIQNSQTNTFSLSYSEDSMYNNYNNFARSLKMVPSSTVRTTSLPDSFEESLSKTFKSLLELLYKSRNFTGSNFDYYQAEYNAFSFASGNDTITWNQVTDTSFSIAESESTSFSSTGTAITADGRELSFNVSFTMSRSFKAEFASSEFTQYNQVLTDPLVINLDSSPASVSDQTFYFDIDCDGIKDELSFAGAGSGFLAYDKNNDGVINDGSELFGTRSGNGFGDLAVHDDDGNGWIDEADSIYEHLKVWTKDSDGNDKLISLKDAGVGAIYLGSADTRFSLTDNDNSLNALIRRSGVFLHEDGSSGSIYQMDLAKHNL